MLPEQELTNLDNKLNLNKIVYDLNNSTNNIFSSSVEPFET